LADSSEGRRPQHDDGDADESVSEITLRARQLRAREKIFLFAPSTSSSSSSSSSSSGSSSSSSSSSIAPAAKSKAAKPAVGEGETAGESNTAQRGVDEDAPSAGGRAPKDGKINPADGEKGEDQDFAANSNSSANGSSDPLTASEMTAFSSAAGMSVFAPSARNGGARTSGSQRQRLKSQRHTMRTKKALETTDKLFRMAAELRAKRAEKVKAADLEDRKRATSLFRAILAKKKHCDVEHLMEGDYKKTAAQRDEYTGMLFEKSMEWVHRKQERVASARPPDRTRELKRLLAHSAASFHKLRAKGLLPAQDSDTYFNLREQDSRDAFSRLHDLNKAKQQRRALLSERTRSETLALSKVTDRTLKASLQLYVQKFGGAASLVLEERDPAWTERRGADLWREMLTARKEQFLRKTDAEFFRYHAPQIALQVKYEQLAANGQWDPNRAWDNLHADHARKQARKENLVRQHQLAQESLVESLSTEGLRLIVKNSFLPCYLVRLLSSAHREGRASRSSLYVQSQSHTIVLWIF